jgi:hypothetical protein
LSGCTIGGFSRRARLHEVSYVFRYICITEKVASPLRKKTAVMPDRRWHCSALVLCKCCYQLLTTWKSCAVGRYARECGGTASWTVPFLSFASLQTVTVGYNMDQPYVAWTIHRKLRLMWWMTTELCTPSWYIRLRTCLWIVTVQFLVCIPFRVNTVSLIYIIIIIFIIIIIKTLQPFVGPWPPFQFLDPIHTIGRTPWTGDQPVWKPLPTHRTTQTQNKRTQYRHPCIE